MNKVIGIVVLVFVIAGLAAYGIYRKGAAAESNGNNAPRIICTTYPVYLFAREILKDTNGPQAELLLAPDTGCPHDYALTPSDLMKLAGDNILLLKNGLGLDDNLCKDALHANPAIKVVDTSVNAHAIPVEKHAHHTPECDKKGTCSHGHHHHGHNHHHHGAEFNPHLFASPDTAAIVVANISAALQSFHPECAEFYKKNTESFLTELETLKKDFLAAGFTKKNIAVQHDVFAYLARMCGLKEAVSLHAESAMAPSPAEVALLKKEIKEQEVAVLFSEPQYPAEFAKLISVEAGIPHHVLDSVTTGPEQPEPGHYIRQMRANLETMKGVLTK